MKNIIIKIKFDKSQKRMKKITPEKQHPHRFQKNLLINFLTEKNESGDKLKVIFKKLKKDL